MKVLFFVTGFLVCASAMGHAECFGSDEYQVCSNSYTDSEGNIHVFM